ncbi:hypothetical protein PspS35_03195 [Pseudomonas sp. S35]|uniref:hypothetical protein n=1 Tax=Pseudomonas sp. S35 TaxID=1573719 RepID=UPI00132F4A7E|nr:hypothetical protein [Pseudomonas sp. S35]QHF42845.1 hypothetical protein PspS35_03195 [Pseudomonas sp. S35]
MNITKTLWATIACALVTIAGCTSGQGPTNAAGILQVKNESQFNLMVSQGTELHPLAPGASIELPINSRGVNVSRRNSNVDRIDQVNLEFNPGQCAYYLCQIFR